MASGMKAAGAYPTTNTTAAAANEAAIAAADPAATVMADGTRAGADRQISRSSLAATASAAHTARIIFVPPKAEVPPGVPNHIILGPEFNRAAKPHAAAPILGYAPR